jgi:large subunit ribosomal protein L29
MKASNLREKIAEDLQKELIKQREKLRKLRFKLVTGEVKNTSEIRQIKRDIARILTIFHEKSETRNKS